jgi:osmotically-inducible protein OsmY
MKDGFFRLETGNIRGAMIVILTILAFALSMVGVEVVTGSVNRISITDAVDRELRGDLKVPAHKVDVMTTDGVVTLSGTVNNLLAKERAAKIAMTVKGVRAVVNDIEVMPSILRTDRDIRRDIEDALLYDPATDSCEIDVAIKNNVATLSGTVNSLQEKELCVTVVKGVRGVTAVNDKIKVERSEKRPDSEIKADIEKALQWDAYVDHVMIQTEVTDGIVHLSRHFRQRGRKTSGPHGCLCQRCSGGRRQGHQGGKMGARRRPER